VTGNRHLGFEAARNVYVYVVVIKQSH